jgi:hypothetical protein
MWEVNTLQILSPVTSGKIALLFCFSEQMPLVIMMKLTKLHQILKIRDCLCFFSIKSLENK